MLPPHFANFFWKLCLVSLAVSIFCTCSRKVTSCDNRPSMSQKKIRETFQPILDFMNYKPGMSFADVGAGSGAVTVSISTLMDNSSVYIQDIDSTILSQEKLNKIIDHYSKQSKRNLRANIKFQTVVGNVYQTNLPG